jgi:alpha-glucosidase
MSASSTQPAWWRDAVVYQLYVRSFRDSDGDGIGDLGGVTQKLDYIAQLGVDAVWLNPCYPSPNRDGGYDVADYVDIDERYGGLLALEKLLTSAHERGIRVLLDLVPNHCSDQHPWFRAALAAPLGSPERARFHFREGRGADGAEPPNNWQSTFGGPAWTRAPDGQWYLHSFDSTQPDLNWGNPDVADMFDDVLRTWFDRGVDGFRIDVAYAMVKHPDLPDVDEAGGNPYQWNQPGVHKVFRRWRAVADAYQRDIPLIGEVWLPAPEAGAYIRPGRLDQVFYFDLMLQPWDAAAFRATIEETLRSVPSGGGTPAWTLNNHDVHRSVSRYGLVEAEPIYTNDANARRSRPRGRVDVALGARRARAAALLMLALPGSAYLFQGEELGLPEVLDLPDDARQDPIWVRSEGREHGRDGSRIPLPWAAAESSFGFSPDGALPAWLPQPEWFADFAADNQQGDPHSTLALYRRAIAARRELFGDPGHEWLDTGRDDVLALRRAGSVCAVNFGTRPYDLPASWGGLVLASTPEASGPILPPDTAAWLRIGSLA